MPIVIESYREFAARHGEAVEVGGRLLFPDGAQCDASEGIVRREPPANPTELLKLRRVYVREKLRRASDDFTGLKSHCQEQAALAARYANLPGPSVDAPQELRRLKGIVEQLRQDLESIETELAGTPEAQCERAREAVLADQRSRQAALIAEISAIEI